MFFPRFTTLVKRIGFLCCKRVQYSREYCQQNIGHHPRVLVGEGIDNRLWQWRQRHQGNSRAIARKVCCSRKHAVCGVTMFLSRAESMSTNLREGARNDEQHWEIANDRQSAESSGQYLKDSAVQMAKSTVVYRQMSALAGVPRCRRCKTRSRWNVQLAKCLKIKF